MRIYTKVVISMTAGEVIEELFEEYQGPVTYCGGGKPDMPDMPPPPPPPKPGQGMGDAAANARKAMRSRLTGMKGWMGTTMTGAGGLMEKAKTTADKNKLLSGVS